jgi:UDP-N-acetylmuramoyl-tripeptide--D-alanyl-D-alanine ligase
VLFANAENEFILQRMGKYPNRITYAAGAAGQYRAKEIAVSNRGTAFTVTTPTGEQARFETQLIGAHNVVNLVGAIAVAHHLGVPLMQLRGEMRKIVPAPHRLELQDQGWALVIDDGYNSNPAGAKAALDALALFEGEKILVTPGMIELGPQQEERNRAFGAQAAAVCDRILLVGAAQTRPIREGVLAAGFPPAQLQTVETLQQAIAAIRATPPGRRKIILLENDLPDNFSPA